MTGPAIILSHPQLGENIGAAARAMLNFGLTDLRLVNPRDGWPNKKAEAMSVGAITVLEKARLCTSMEEAIGDLGLVFATTGRDRLMSKRTATPDEAVQEITIEISRQRSCGIMFGAERMGLTNEELVLADAILTVPTNPQFASLNLAQSVAVVGYEWWKANNERPDFRIPAKYRRTQLANKKDMIDFFGHLEGELDRTEFLFPPAKRPAMVQNLRNMWHRAELTYQEVQTLRGIIRSLTGAKKRGQRDDGS